MHHTESFPQSTRSVIYTCVCAHIYTRIQARIQVRNLAPMHAFVVAELTEISTRSVVSSHSFSSPNIPKPYNFYTWHTPNMAGRQSLYLITLQRSSRPRVCSLYKPLNLFSPSLNTLSYLFPSFAFSLFSLIFFFLLFARLLAW